MGLGDAGGSKNLAWGFAIAHSSLNVDVTKNNIAFTLAILKIGFLICVQQTTLILFT